VKNLQFVIFFVINCFRVQFKEKMESINFKIISALMTKLDETKDEQVDQNDDYNEQKEE
jgi:hypothetical protein